MFLWKIERIEKQDVDLVCKSLVTCTVPSRPYGPRRPRPCCSLCSCCRTCRRRPWSGPSSSNSGFFSGDGSLNCFSSIAPFSFQVLWFYLEYYKQHGQKKLQRICENIRDFSGNSAKNYRNWKNVQIIYYYYLLVINNRRGWWFYGRLRIVRQYFGNIGNILNNTMKWNYGNI